MTLSPDENEFLFTSESVTEGHPDKIADQISDAVLDRALAADPYSRVACETMLTTGLVLVAGEITTSAHLDIHDIVRSTIRDIGYTSACGFDGDACAVLVALGPAVAGHLPGRRHGARGTAVRQRQRIRPGGRRRSGDDVRLRNERDARANADADLRSPTGWPGSLRTCGNPASGPSFGPTARRRSRSGTPDGVPVAVEKVLISAQHEEGAEDRLPDQIWDHVVHGGHPAVPLRRQGAAAELLREPDGRFVVGGPVGDAGTHRPQDHRRHVRRLRPARRRRVLR